MSTSLMMPSRFIPVLCLAIALGLAAGCSSEEATQAGGASEADAEHAAKSSSAGLPSGHADAGQKLSMAKNAATGQSCVDCHGAAGNAPIDATYPKLGGQYADYLAHSLQSYREGKRSNALMASQAKTLTDQQIADLAAYFASQPGHLTDLAAVE